jgi:uncharacterized linocin/CFP29 family protein
MATATIVPPATGTQPGQKPPQHSFPPTNAGNGRDKIHWSKEVWDRIDKAVHAEMMRTRIAQKFLPIRPVVPRTTSVPFDSIQPPSGSDPTFSVDEGATTRLNEYWVEFSLTPQQVDHETGDLAELGHSTAVTLATRAANILAQAEDLVTFQGANALTTNLFKPPVPAGAGAVAPPPSVLFRGSPSDSGLLDLPIGGAAAPPLLPPVQAVPVLLDPARAGAPGVYGSNTFQAVAAAYSILQGAAQYGPYALVLQTTPYADTYAPVAAGLVITADRIKPLMTAGLYGTGTLPINIPASVSFVVPPAPPAGNASFTGVLVSLGGNTMDVVVGLDATTAFMQQDPNGNFRFRVVERFALRLKDTTAAIRLEFQ